MRQQILGHNPLDNPIFAYESFLVVKLSNLSPVYLVGTANRWFVCQERRLGRGLALPVMVIHLVFLIFCFAGYLAIAIVFLIGCFKLLHLL